MRDTHAIYSVARAAILLSVLTATTAPALPFDDSAAMRFVGPGPGGGNDGTSWNHAYHELRDALAEASINPAVTEIWVAGGTYKPTAGNLRNATFQLISGVAVRGGFGGFENSLSERDLAVNETILSGDLGVVGSTADNTFHVVTGSGADATALLEAVTITGGAANLSSTKRYGGGVLIEGAGSDPVLIGCTLRGNIAEENGGGLFNVGGAPTLINCIFRQNSVFGDGGGVYTDAGDAAFVNCTFFDNSASGDGGGVFTFTNEGSACPDNASFLNCVFWDNSDGTPVNQHDQIAAPVRFCPPEFAVRSAPTAFRVLHSAIQFWDGSFGGPTNSAADPLFADADGRLGVNSLCIGHGSNAYLPADAFDVDGDGNVAEPSPIDRDGDERVIMTDVDAGAFEYGFDCNANGVPDAADVAGGTSADCNTNGTPDECDPATDCNLNGVADWLDISAGTSADCNADCLPDNCLAFDDCNLNSVPDECDIAGSASTDCNSNGTPDECEDDCNTSGAPDDCDIAAGTSRDCNTNGLPDECETSAVDCNANNVPDECELAAASAFDCDGDNTLDECDITAGTASDCDGNAVPDACEIEQRFFVLENAGIGAPSRVRRFDPASAGFGAPVAAHLPASGNDRGLTAYDGAGQLLVCDENHSRLLEVNVFSGQVVSTLNLDRPVLEIAYDWTTGNLYATATDSALYLVNLLTGNTTFISALPGDTTPDWVCLTFDDRTQRLLAANQTQQRIYMVDPATGSGNPLPQPLGTPLGDIAVDFTDGTIYGVGVAGTLFIVARDTGVADPVHLLPGISGTGAGIAVLLASDCTNNGVLDGCEIAGGSAADCNANLLPDVCDPDCNLNGQPDACETLAPLDWDGDGDSDLHDFVGFPACLGGPGATPSPNQAACLPQCLWVYDLDLDGDVDLVDFAAVQFELGGP